MTTLVNIHKTNDYDVYIGRAGKGMDGYFGNPKEHGNDGSGRDTIVERYKMYFYKRISEDDEFRRRVASLKNKRLGCFCLPKKCHGMVIIEYLEGISIEEQMQIFNTVQKKWLKQSPSQDYIDVFDD